MPHPDTHTSSALVSSERWAELQALEIIQGNLNRFMGKLNLAEQKDYLRLSKEQVEREAALSQALNSFYRELDQQLLDALEAALKLKAGKPIDARRTFLKTRIRQLPVPPGELPDIATDDPLSRHLHIFKEDLSVREYERSLTLLEAAQRNFGFTAYFSTDEQNASYLSDNALSVFDFVAVARQVDLGQRVLDYIEQHFDARLSTPLFAVHGVKLTLAVYDAYRTEASWSIGAQEFASLRLQIGDKTINWERYQVDAGGEKIALPFFTRRFETPNGPRVYSYFPDRPDGAFRRHFSISEAEDELAQQLRNQVGLKSFDWFMKAISLNNQEKIRTFIKPLTVNRDKLYWHARILYDLFASKTPNRQKLNVERFGTDTRSLLHTLPISLSWPIRSDLARLARNTRLADRDAAVTLLEYIVSETLSMLLIPVPGGVTGLSKVMLLATLGTLTVQTVQAVTALRQGRQAELIQAVSDIFDLLASARVQGVASRLSTRRTRQLIRALGYPRAGTHDAPGLWFMEAYTQVDPARVHGLEPNNQGVYEHGGQHFIKISLDGEDKIARVVAHNGRYRMTYPNATFEPYVTYYPQRKRWALDPIDKRHLSNNQLLQQMLAPTHRPLSPEGCRRALEVAGVDRRQLLDIWSAHASPRWTFSQAIEEQHLREQLGLLQGALQQTSAALPDVSERVLPALLADLGRCAISVYNADGVTQVAHYASLPAANERPVQTLELLRTDKGLYRTRALASTQNTLLHHALQEYERLHPNGTLGKTGQNAQDQHLENRLTELRKALSQHLGQHLDSVYRAVQADQSREHLSAAHAAYRFAPAAKASDASVANTLRQRFPELSRSAADELVRLHPSLSTGAYSPIDASARAAIHTHLAQSVVTQALGALSDPAGIGLNEHSQALFCNLLPLLPQWPDGLAVRVYQATYDHGGRMIGRGALLDTYGDPAASTFVMLVKDNHRYAGYLQDSNDLQVPPPAENSLVSTLLRTLTDTQRNSLGRGIYDRGGLVSDVLMQARVHREHLPGFLPPSRQLPLSSEALRDFRAFDMRQVMRVPDADGILQMAGRFYVNIDEVTYQVMLDRDASTADAKVWRIVNPKDPVAMDSANIYHASRSGESRAITRNAANLWVTAVVGAVGGMRQATRVHDTRAYLMQRFEPIRDAFNVLSESAERYEELQAEMTKQVPESAAEQAALVALEVHILKHVKMQSSYVTSLIDNKDWLIHVKASGLYKQELLAQQRERVEFLNKLMVVMDLRVRPIIEKEITVETCKKNLAHMNKKLKILEDRRLIVEQTRRLSRGDADEMERKNRSIPGEERVQATRLNVYIRLIANDPTDPPTLGTLTTMATHWVVKDLPNIPERSQPIALHLALEQIAVEKSNYAALLASAAPQKTEYIKGALSIIEFYELKIEGKLNEILGKLQSNQDLPIYDQDIDFDFMPTQPLGSTEPVQPKRMFRTRQHGLYKVMVGTQETAPDGTVTVKVDDPYKIDAPPRRYEKIQGEWQPVATTSSRPTKSRLVSEANELLANVDEHLRVARAHEEKKRYPANIYEFLGSKAESLDELARKLEGGTQDAEATALATRLKASSDKLMNEARDILVRMYKNKDVLDVLRLDYLLEHAQLKVVRTVNRKQLGKGKESSYLDVYAISDAADNTPLWEAHFHYDRLNRPALDYTTKGGHLKTLAQSRQGSSLQQREEQAGRVHQPIWREAISPKVAQKLFDRAQ